LQKALSCRKITLPKSLDIDNVLLNWNVRTAPEEIDLLT